MPLLTARNFNGQTKSSKPPVWNHIVGSNSASNSPEKKLESSKATTTFGLGWSVPRLNTKVSISSERALNACPTPTMPFKALSLPNGGFASRGVESNNQVSAPPLLIHEVDGVLRSSPQRVGVRPLWKPTAGSPTRLSQHTNTNQGVYHANHLQDGGLYTGLTKDKKKNATSFLDKVFAAARIGSGNNKDVEADTAGVTEEESSSASDTAAFEETTVMPKMEMPLSGMYQPPKLNSLLLKGRGGTHTGLSLIYM